MLRLHLRYSAHSRHSTLHRLLISSSEFIVMSSSHNLFKTKPLAMPSIPTSPFSFQTQELFHTRGLLFSNNSSKPTSNFRPFSLRNSGFSYAAHPSVPPPGVSLCSLGYGIFFGGVFGDLSLLESAFWLCGLSLAVQFWCGESEEKRWTYEPRELFWSLQHFFTLLW